MTKERENWVDVTRGFAIYLVVLGHSVQYASHQGYDYRANTLFSLIYGFHMALFMTVSGYLLHMPVMFCYLIIQLLVCLNM